MLMPSNILQYLKTSYNKYIACSFTSFPHAKAPPYSMWSASWRTKCGQPHDEGTSADSIPHHSPSSQSSPGSTIPVEPVFSVSFFWITTGIKGILAILGWFGSLSQSVHEQRHGFLKWHVLKKVIDIYWHKMATKNSNLMLFALIHGKKSSIAISLKFI